MVEHSQEDLLAGDLLATDLRAMGEALRLAEAAGRLGNVPIGAVAMHGGVVVARSGNLRETLQDPTAHAEMLALRDASRRLGSWRLEEVTLYVTLEPCEMCAAALRQARVGRLVFGAREPKTGSVISTRRVLEGSPVVIEEGIGAEASQGLLRSFFETLRAR